MKISCDVCRDLLLLYEDELCSAESRELVEEHLADCEACRKFLEKMRLPQEMAVSQPLPEALQEKKTLKKAFRRIRLRWQISLAVLLLLIPVVGLGKLCFGQITGSGVCFTNLDEIWKIRSFFRLLEQGEYAEAADMLTYEEQYRDIVAYLATEEGKRYEPCYRKVYGDVSGMTLEEFEGLKRERFAAFLEENGLAIRRISLENNCISRMEYGWCIGFTVTEETGQPGYEQLQVGYKMAVSGEKLCLVSEWFNTGPYREYVAGKHLEAPLSEDEIDQEILDSMRWGSVLQNAFNWESSWLSRLMNEVDS